MEETTKDKDDKPSVFVRWLEPVRDDVYERAPALTIKTLWLQYLKKRTLTALAYIVWFTWSLGMIFVPTYSDHNGAADARGRIETSISNQQAVNDRKQLASQILDGYWAGIHSDVNTGGDTPEQLGVMLSQLERTKTTGQPVDFDTRHDSWTNHPWDAIQVFLYVFLVLTSLALSVRYSFRTLVKAEFLADLPWKRVWPFGFVALMPLMVPAFIVSAIRFYRLEDEDEEVTDEVEEESYSFDADEEAARKLYFDLRFEGWRSYVNDRKAEITRRLEELQNRAKARNVERRELLADQQRLQHFDVTTDAADSETVAKEFAAILADERVLGIRGHYGQLHVLVAAKFRHESVLYDLGDWLIKVGTFGLTTQEVRTGTKVKWHEFAHPIYRIDDGVFCFGARRATLDQLLEKGKICEAILLAVSCLNTINEDDLHLVSKAFKVIDEPVS